MMNTQGGRQYVALTSDYAASFTGEWIDMSKLAAHQISFMIYHGNCTGTYAIECTNDPRVADGTRANPVKDLTTILTDTDYWDHPGGSAATDFIPICGLPVGWVRLKYTHSSGSSIAMYVSVALPTQG